MTTQWQDKLTCFSPSYIEHRVEKDLLRFYPVSVGMMFRLKVIGRPMARSLSVLFSKNERDAGTKDVMLSQGKDDGGNDLYDRQIEIMPITEGMAKIRHEQRVEAIEGLVDAVTNPENAKVIGEIIMDSLREVFDRDERSEWPPPEEFISLMPLPVLTEMVTGVVLANKGVLGPLSKAVTETLKNTVTVNADAISSVPSTSPESESPGLKIAEQEARPVSG